MSFTNYHTYVVGTVGSDSYNLPVGNLVVKNDPASRAGSFSLQRFNSSMKQRIDGWLIRANFSYDEVTGSANDIIRQFIQATMTAGICVIDFDPEDEFPAEDRTVTFVLESAPGAVIASFNGRARNRISEFKLVSKTWRTAPLEWITA